MGALRLGARLLGIRCFGLFVSVGYDGVGGFACFAVVYLLVGGFGLSLFCVWGSAECVCVCVGGLVQSARGFCGFLVVGWCCFLVDSVVVVRIQLPLCACLLCC